MGGVGGQLVLGAVEVVHIVVVKEDHLDGVGRPVEVPDAGRRPEPHGEARSGGEKGPTVAGVLDRPLAVGVLEVVTTGSQP